MISRVGDIIYSIREKIEDTIAEEYSSEKCIENVEDYKNLLAQMIKEKVLVSL